MIAAIKTPRAMRNGCFTSGLASNFRTLHRPTAPRWLAEVEDALAAFEFG
jgi:hypothetical protein